MENINKFGERLLKLREDCKETQQQLADAIGITRQSLSRYETNERTPNIDLIYKVSKHYNVSADYLLGLSEIKSSNNKIRNACEITGLEESAIEKLQLIKSMTDNYKNVTMLTVMNDLINDKDFIHIIRDCLNLYRSSSELVEKLLNKQSINHNDELIEKTDLQLFRASERFRNILEKLKNPAYCEALKYINKYCVFHIKEGINNGYPFLPLTPPVPLRPMMPPYPKSLPTEIIDELKKNEPTQQEIDEYNKQLDYYNKTCSQEKLDFNKIKELFEKEVTVDAEHNPTSE